MALEFILLVQTILKMAVLIGIGFIISYKIPLTKDIRKFLIMLIINIALPSLIVNSYFQLTIDHQILTQSLLIFIFSVSFNLFSIAAAFWIAKIFFRQKKKAREIAFLSALGNTGLIGIPLCATLFGAKGAIFAAVFDAGMSIILWSLGVMLVQQHGKISWKTLKSVINMPMIAVVIGFSITLLHIHPTYFVKSVVSTLGYAATPLAMFYIGMLIMSIIREKRKVAMIKIALPVTLKLIAFPMAAILVLMLLSWNESITNILLIEITMPTISTASIIMALNQADEDLGVITTLSSTILSLVSIPVLVIIGRVLIF